MRTISLLGILMLSLNINAQSLPFGTVYGKKPDHTGMVTAANLENYMGKRTRISATISGRITQVTKAKGGWFDVDAGNGNIITAHFKEMGITLPMNLKNRYIITEGVAEKQIVADDQQHFAGSTGGGKAAPKQFLMFEVTGLEVRK